VAYLNLGRRDLRAAEVREQQLKQALDFQPDLASVVCGGNDMLVPEFDPDAVEHELDLLVRSFREIGADVLTFTLQDITAVFPELAGLGLRERIESLNERTRVVSARHDAMVADMWAHPTCGDRNFFSADMLHASMRGHAVLASVAVNCLGERLATRSGPPA
jgi:lysophospholipase L1-like esterase